MELAPAILGPLVALVGVWLGGWLTSRSVRQAAEIEQQRRSHEELRRVYSTYLAVCRQFVDHLKRPANKVRLARSTDGAIEVPLLSREGRALRQAVEAASADMLLMAHSSIILERARLLRVAAIRFAVGRARSSDGFVPEDDRVAFLDAEQEFVNAVRTDLGMSTMDVSLWTNPIGIPGAAAQG
jgi:hypothetical protein